MRLTCPNCGARYEVDDALIPPEGRDVQCSDCFTTWFQAGLRRVAPEPAAPRRPFPAAPAAEAGAGPETGPETPVTDTPEPPGVTAETGEATADEAIVERAAEVPSHPPEPAPEPAPKAVPETVAEEALAQSLRDAVADAAGSGPEVAPEDQLAAIAEGAETATRVVVVNVAAEPEADTDGKAETQTEATQSDPTPRREIDPSVRDILKAEADREARLRKAEAQPVETQAEMPLDETPQDVNRARRRAELENSEDAYTVGAATTGYANGSRRDLLPDIEEINSTLRATEDRRGETGEDAVALRRVAEAQRRRGVRLGFLVTLALTAGLIWLYLNADAVGNRVPALAGAVEGFTTRVDVARYWLDDLAQGLATSEDGS